MKSPEELRKELAVLEGQPQPDTPAQPDDKSIRGIFDHLICQSDEQSRQRQEKEDRTMKVCSNCFRLQDQENITCELCDASPEWRVPSAVRRNDEQAKFLSLAENTTVEELRNALRSAWCSNNERQRVTRLLLSLREAQKTEKLVEQIVEDSVVENASDIDLSKVAAYYDYQIAKIEEQQRQLKQQAQA